MRALLVTPIQEGSGETITMLHVGENLVARGHAIRFLASPLARGFLEGRFGDAVRPLGGDGAENRRLWDATLREFRPDVVVFADYPWMPLPKGCVPLAAEPGWVESLDDLDACLVTLDHFGFAQRAMNVFSGPPHLSLHYHAFSAIPSRMRILLPCPMHEPGPVDGRKGECFRYWDVPLGIPGAARRETRARYLAREDDLLVFHPVPSWAWRSAEATQLPYYDVLPEILDYYFGDLPRPVTIVSVNNGRLLAPRAGSQVRIVNLPPIPTEQFEALLFSADLVTTENKVSIAMGKAICGLQPCAALKNSYRVLELMDRLEGPLRDVVLAMERRRLGSIYPYEVFPTGMGDVLEEIILYRGNSLTDAFWDCEVFGGEPSRAALRRYLTDPSTRAELRARQQVYLQKLRQVGDSAQVLEALVEEHRGGR